MLSWLTVTTLETTLLIGVVLLGRPLIRRVFGANVAYTLWLIPLIGVLLPARPPRPATPLEVIRLPDAEFSQALNSAAESFGTPSGLPLEWLWFAGVGIFLTAQLVRVARFRDKVRSASAPFAAPSHILELLERYGISPTCVFTTTLAGAPFVTGLRNARVFLPTDFLERFSVEEQRWIVIHELTHVRRGDLWLRLAAEAFRALFWFNPLVHVAVHALQQDQEYACDQAVVSRCTRQERYQYGKALMLGANPQRLPSLTFFRNSKERYVMLGKHRKSALNTLVGMGTCLLIGVYSLTSAPISVAQNAAASEYDLTRYTQLQAEVHMARLERDSEGTLRVLAPDQAGKSQEWTVVLPTGRELREAGIKLTFFAPGHGYVITGHAASDPADHRLFAMTVTRPDGAVWAR
jgi:beta-lactamase regulating signal transducer with metallopeptidase domain